MYKLVGGRCRSGSALVDCAVGEDLAVDVVELHEARPLKALRLEQRQPQLRPPLPYVPAAVVPGGITFCRTAAVSLQDVITDTLGDDSSKAHQTGHLRTDKTKYHLDAICR